MVPWKHKSTEELGFAELSGYANLELLLCAKLTILLVPFRAMIYEKGRRISKGVCFCLKSGFPDLNDVHTGANDPPSDDDTTDDEQGQDVADSSSSDSSDDSGGDDDIFEITSHSSSNKVCWMFYQLVCIIH